MPGAKSAMCGRDKTNALRKFSLRLLQSLEAAGVAPDTVVNAPPKKKKPAMVFNMNNGTPIGQGGKPVKNDGGGKTVTPHKFIFVKPHPVG